MRTAIVVELLRKRDKARFKDFVESYIPIDNYVMDYTYDCPDFDMFRYVYLTMRTDTMHWGAYSRLNALAKAELVVTLVEAITWVKVQARAQTITPNCADVVGSWDSMASAIRTSYYRLALDQAHTAPEAACFDGF